MWKTKLRDYALITFGILLVAAALEYFYIPANIAAGGVAGIAIILRKFLPQISQSVFVLVMNLILFVIGFLTLGSKFGAKTVYSSLGLAGVMWLIERFLEPRAVTDDIFLMAVFGTLLASVGMGIVLNRNASTGGTDIVAKILSKYLHINVGRALLGVDALIGLACIPVFGVRTGLYAVLCIVVNGTLIDRVIDGVNTSKAVMVFSDKKEDILHFILNKLQRSATVLKAAGGYTGAEREVLYVILSRREYVRLREFIRKTDPNAFLTVSEAHEVLGEGFRNLSGE